MGTFFEHFIGNHSVSSNLTIECDFNGIEYVSFSLDGHKYSERNLWDQNEYQLFDHHYNSMILKGYDEKGQYHIFQATIDLDWGSNHNKLIDFFEIKS
jgi:hypothetical protein